MRRPSSSSTSSSFEVRKITGIWLFCLRSWLEQLHAVHARHLDVEHGEIDRLRGHAPSAPRRRRCSSARQTPPPRAPSTPRSGCCGRHRRVRSYWSRASPPMPRRAARLPRAAGVNGLTPKYGCSTANRKSGGSSRHRNVSPLPQIRPRRGTRRQSGAAIAARHMTVSARSVSLACDDPISFGRTGRITDMHHE